jgi:hypothetical protein
MEVRFVGGPLDGQSREIGDEPEEGHTILWQPGADTEGREDAVPGADDVVEYLYRGRGTADYVGGILDGE